VVAVLAQTTPGSAASALEPDLQQVAAYERLGEHYELEGPLGSGGMGVVIAGRHRLLGHAVAIKVLRPSLKLHPGTEQRFLVEAKAGARLSSPHVARVLDGGLSPDGLPYLVMERLQGADGERHLSTHGVPSIAETLDLIVQVLDALAEAHAVGLVHRDMKPANLFLTRQASGRLHVKVLDFGLAKVLGDDLGLTSSQGFLGSPLYVAPEQLRRSSDVDARADVWGVGCLLYRFLTGRVPFPAGSVAEVVTRIQRDDPTPVKALRPDVSDELSSLVSQLLEKNPLKRPASVAEVGLRLRPLVSGATANELDALLHQLPVLAIPLVSPPKRTSPRWLLVTGLSAATLGVAVGWWLPRPAPSEPTRPVREGTASSGSEVAPNPAAVTSVVSTPAPADPPTALAPAPMKAPTEDTPEPTRRRAITTSARDKTGRDGGSSNAFEGRE
jgi:serine/threonine-protein kinase